MRHFIVSAVLLLSCPAYSHSKSIVSTQKPDKYGEDNLDNSIIDFDEEYTLKYNKKYGTIPWNSNEYFNKETNRYTIVKDLDKKLDRDRNETEAKLGPTSTIDYSVIPLELISTTENTLISILESTEEPDLTVIPLSTTRRTPKVEIKQTVTLPTSTQEIDTTTYYSDDVITTEVPITEKYISERTDTTELDISVTYDTTTETSFDSQSTLLPMTNTSDVNFEKSTIVPTNTTSRENISRVDFTADGGDTDSDVPIFTELDTEDHEEVPEDYYDSKDVVPTTAPKTDALSVIFGLAGSVVGSVVETVAERVVPKGIVDLFRRMQRQSEMLEAERLRSREENGGIGKLDYVFNRNIIKGNHYFGARRWCYFTEGLSHLLYQSLLSALAGQVHSIYVVLFSKDRLGHGLPTWSSYDLTQLGFKRDCKLGVYFGLSSLTSLDRRHRRHLFF